MSLIRRTLSDGHSQLRLLAGLYLDRLATERCEWRPDDGVPGAAGSPLDLETAVAAHPRVVRVRDHQQVPVHLRMDVAVDGDDAGLLQRDRLGDTAAIQPEIEFGIRRRGKDVVVEPVAVGKGDGRPTGTMRRGGANDLSACAI